MRTIANIFLFTLCIILIIIIAKSCNNTNLCENSKNKKATIDTCKTNQIETPNFMITPKGGLGISNSKQPFGFGIDMSGNIVYGTILLKAE